MPAKYEGSAIAYFLERINIEAKDNGHWLWTGSVNTDGYGRLRPVGLEELAHVFSYKWFVGPIPEGREIDHLCRVRLCTCPDHLEAVTHRENTTRRDMYCRKGHMMQRGKCITCIEEALDRLVG